MPVEDPIVRAGRREAALTLLLWLAALVYTVTYCYLYGYGRPLEEMKFVLWFPDWIFWGIVVPWLTCVTLSTAFAFWFMGDEPLGEDPAEIAGENGGRP